MTQMFNPLGWRRAVSALVLGVLLFGYLLRLHFDGPVVPLLIVSGTLIAAALVGLPVTGLALGSLGGTYVAALVGAGGELDGGAPFFGVGLLFLADLLYLEKIPPEVTSPDAARGRGWWIVGSAIAGFALGSLVLLLGSSVALTGPVPLAAAGLVAALILGSVAFSSGSLLARDPARRQDR